MSPAPPRFAMSVQPDGADWLPPTATSSPFGQPLIPVSRNERRAVFGGPANPFPVGGPFPPATYSPSLLLRVLAGEAMPSPATARHTTKGVPYVNERPPGGRVHPGDRFLTA